MRPTIPIAYATRAAAAALLLALAALPASAGEAPGTRIRVDPAALPAPDPEGGAAFSPEPVAIPSPPPLRLPPGFAVNLFAEGLADARWLAVAPDGDVFLDEPRPGRVTVLRDVDGDGRADVVRAFAGGFAGPHGLAVREGWLYVADTERVWRLPRQAGALAAAGPAEPVTPPGALGDADGHWTRNIAFSADGTRLFVAIGSASNIGEDPLPRASVQSFAADGSDRQTYAFGLRNPVGIAVQPGSGDLYVVVNERDGMGDGLVPDFLTRLEEGGFYGWPYSYIGPNPQPSLAGPPDLVARAIMPDLLFRSHSAPLGLVFYEGVQFPADYRGDAFVALHGSWNSSTPEGYMVVRVPFEDGRPAGWYEPFLVGFLTDGGNAVFGRPVGLAVAADGSLLIADDLADVIWRVSYMGR
jgi:glucose/arabinose dehydrogenase